MSIYCSNLPNDQDMIHALGSIAVPIPIDHGDACFSGIGLDNAPILVSVERKKVGDLCQCITSGRYLTQAQTAKELGADVLCLIAEVGEVRASPDDGLLEALAWGVNPRTFRKCQLWKPVQPAMLYSRFDQFLTELDYLVGVIVKRSRDVWETAAIIKALYNNFQQPPQSHHSLKQIYKQPPQVVQFVKPSLVKRVAVELPGIGWEWSESVCSQFHSVKELALGCVEDWAKLRHENNGKSRVLGKKVAEKIIQALGGGQGK